MEQFKNKCCNHQGGSTTNPPITNFKPQGQLEPGKDPGNITQSCFTLNKLPNIETVKELAFELCNVQQAFDKCPQYYTKSNFDALIDTITKAFFHLYVKLAEVTETPWFEGYAELDLDPVEKAKKENKKFPGFYLIKDVGQYPNFKDINGDILNVYESDLIDHIIFFKPVFDLGFNFLGYEKVSTQIKGIQDLYNKITTINAHITMIYHHISDINNRVIQEGVSIENFVDLFVNTDSDKNVTITLDDSKLKNKIDQIEGDVTKIQGDVTNIDNRVTILEGKSVVLQQSIKYSELLDLINTNSLNPGQEYRITDYTFTTTQESTSSAEHDFDIIVSALSTNTLNENAKAACKENYNYFKDNKLNLWELKYSIYNDTNKYNWADPQNGKGVIYWLKDEFNNEAGYDFKNALFGKQLYVNIPYYEDGVYVDQSGKNYYTFDYVLDRSNADLSLTGAFVDCKIKFSKKLPYNKFCNKGTNVIVEGSLNYIDDGLNFVINGTQNYITTSRNVTLNSDYTIVTNSQNISTQKSSLENIIIQCHDVKLGFENNANYLRNCQYFTTDSRVSSLNIRTWYYCKVCTDSDNIISKDITLEYSTIGYNNYNVTFKGTGTFKNKTIGPSTFNTSWQDPNYEFEFNSEIADEYETISKNQFVTYID